MAEEVLGDAAELVDFAVAAGEQVGQHLGGQLLDRRQFCTEAL
jgi:hypothetical protein